MMKEGDNIPIQRFAIELTRKINNAKSFKGIDSGLMPAWEALKLPQIYNILRNLDSQNKGFVNWRQLFLYMLLITSPIPTEEEINKMVKDLGGIDAEVTRADIICGEFWFDNHEVSKDRPHAHPFKRVDFLKILLFETFEIAETDCFDLKRFVEYLRFARTEKSAKTFNDFLFAKVKLLQQ